MNLTAIKKLVTPYRGAGVLFTAADSSGAIRVLLGERLYRPFAGYWAVPGGKMDEADDGDFRKCAAREVFEETVAISCATRIERLLGRHIQQARMHRFHVPFAHDFRIFRVHLDAMPDVRLWPKMDHYGNEFGQFGWFKANALPAKLHPFLRGAVARLTTDEAAA